MPAEKTLLRRWPLLLLAAWIGLCYVIRFQLMEQARWVAICEANGSGWCTVRQQLGWMIHHRLHVMPAAALTLLAWLIPARAGRVAGWIGLGASSAALALYAVTPASFLFVLCALRLARTPRHSAAASASESSAQPSA